MRWSFAARRVRSNEIVRVICHGRTFCSLSRGRLPCASLLQGAVKKSTSTISVAERQVCLISVVYFTVHDIFLTRFYDVHSDIIAVSFSSHLQRNYTPSIRHPQYAQHLLLQNQQGSYAPPGPNHSTLRSRRELVYRVRFDDSIHTI